MKRVIGYALSFVAGSILSGGVAFAATNMVQAEKGTSVIEYNGKSISSPPKLVYGGTTYVQLYAIQQGLKTVLGANPTWDGTHFNMISTTNGSPEATAEEIIKLSQYQEWDVLYGYLDPDAQAKYTETQFVTDRQKNGAAFATVQSFQTQKAAILPTWTDATGTGKTYQNVADVPLTLTFNGGTTLNASMHLAKAPDGTWRYFWSPAS